MDPMLNMSCNIEYCGYKMHQIVANMILSQYLQVKIRYIERQLYQDIYFIYGSKSFKIIEPIFSLKYDKNKSPIIFGKASFISEKSLKFL